MTDEEEMGGMCIPAEYKDRLLRSYESEMNFYLSRLNKLGDDADPRLRTELERRAKVAELKLKDVESTLVCEAYEEDDVETPAVPPVPAPAPTVPAPASPPPARSPPPS